MFTQFHAAKLCSTLYDMTNTISNSVLIIPPSQGLQQYIYAMTNTMLTPFSYKFTICSQHNMSQACNPPIRQVRLTDQCF